MKTTKQLLDKALSTQPAKFWANRYFIDKSTISAAKKRGHLSPALAGNFAIDLGEDPIRWMAIAAIETERADPIHERIRNMLNQTNPYFCLTHELIAKQSLFYSKTPEGKGLLYRLRNMTGTKKQPP